MVKRSDGTGVFQKIDMRAKDQCWPWLGGWGGRERDPRPYISVDGRRTMAYRIVYELVYGVELERTQMVLHTCDMGRAPVGCCNPHHMRLGGHKQNATDMMHRERYGLPHAVVRSIRKLLAEGRTQQAIADLYGIARETVSAIKVARIYKGVVEQEEAKSEGVEGTQ